MILKTIYLFGTDVPDLSPLYDLTQLEKVFMPFNLSNEEAEKVKKKLPYCHFR